MAEQKLNISKEIHLAYSVWCRLSGKSMKATTDKLVLDHLKKNPMKAKAIEDVLNVTKEQSN